MGLIAPGRGFLTHTRVYYVWGDFFTYWPFHSDIYLLFGVGVLCEVLAVRQSYRTNIIICYMRVVPHLWTLAYVRCGK